MNRFIQKNKFILVMLTIILCLSCAYGLTVKLDPSVNAASVAKTSATDYAWSTMSEAAAQFLGYAGSPFGNHGDEIEIPDSNTGFAGNFLGYMTPGSDSSKFTFASLQSANTVTYSYASLNTLDKVLSKSPAGWTDSAKVYAGFGYALTASGIDEPVIIGQTADDKRNVIGPIVLIVFLLCMALPKFFEMVLTFLSVANPFKLFIGSNSVLKSIVPSIAAGSGFDNQNTAVQSAMSNALNTLSDTVTGLYNALYNLSFAAVIPIMIALALFSWLVLRNKASSVLKKLVTRVVFIGLGVPLLLACYTAAIDSVKDFMIDTATGTPISVITSTFCDYGNWALGVTEDQDSSSYMRLPQDVNLNVDVSSEVYEYKNTSTSDRRIVQLINAGNDVNFHITRALSGNMDANGIAQDDVNLVNSVRGSANENRTAAVINLLQRYTKGEYITAGDFATKFNQRMYANYKEDQAKLFNLSNTAQSYDPIDAVAYKYDKEDGDAWGVDVSEVDAKTFAQKRMIYDTTVVYPWRNPFYSAFTNTVANAPGSYKGTTGPATSDPSGRQWGAISLSKMAAYNLLSSTFSDTGITVYSTTATSTNQVQLAHYAVSIAGQGYMELAYVADAVAIMCCLMVLGYGYGFALLFACFKGLIQIFPKVLTGMIGSLRGIAGSVALVAALIVEIIGTCIMYSLGSMFIGAVYELIEVPLATILTNVAGLPNQAAALVTVVASAVIIIKLTGLLLKYRKAVVTSVSEIATGFINKFMETNVVAPNLESDMSAGDIASVGLGLAMVGASTPVGNKLADGAERLTDKVTNADADKVATATMNGSTRTGSHGEKYASEADAAAAKSSGANNLASDSGGHYDANDHASTASLASTSAKNDDEVAADYVDDNSNDFEKSIGYGNSSSGSQGDKSNREDTDDHASIADHSEDLSNNLTGRTTRGDGSVEEYKNGRLVAAWDKDGNQIVDNSTEEITGTKTLDVSSTTSGETDDDAHADTNKASRATDNSKTEVSGNSAANKLVMTDANGNQQEVSIVNAQTGAAYTQADKDAGVNYDVVDSNGKSIYGNLEGGMSSNTLAMQNGEATMMVAPGSGGTNAFGGGGVYTLAQAPVPEVQASAQTGSGAATQNVTQNVTNVNQNTANSQSQTTVNNTSEGGGTSPVNVHVAADGTSQATPAMSVPAGGGTTNVNVNAPVHDNSGSSQGVTNVNVNASASGNNGGSQGSTYVNVNAPASGGGSGAAQSTNTVERETIQTVTQQNTESVIYQNGGGSTPVAPAGGSQGGNTYVTNHNTTNTHTSNNNNNVNNQTNVTNGSDNSSSDFFGIGKSGGGHRRG